MSDWFLSFIIFLCIELSRIVPKLAEENYIQIRHHAALVRHTEYI